MTYCVQILGFKSKAQAQEFITWYGEQGEQDAHIWFEMNSLPSPMRSYKTAVADLPNSLNTLTMIVD